jgi:beta-N-acetylhexosaminidase
MTPEQKIGRVLCARRTHIPEELEYTLELIKNEAVGCVQVVVNDKAEELIKKLRAAANYPLLIVNDMERGFAPAGLPQIPLINLAAAGPEYVRAFATATAAPAKACGFTGTWGPVVDIMSNVHNPLSTQRMAGDTPEAVTDFAREYLKVFESYRFHGSAKHYPGGAPGVDTHMTEAINPISEEELVNVHIKPYVTLWREGLLHTVMVDHGIFPSVDPEGYPASLSKKVIGLLRREGFDGLVYTDSLAMMAILQKYGEAGAMVLALNAGNDIVLPNYRTPTKTVYEMMVKAYYDGEIDKDRLDEAVRHVMEAEAWCAAAPQAPVPLPENIEEILMNAARDSVTALCDDGVATAIDPAERRLFVVLTENGYTPDSPAEEIGLGKWYSPNRVIDAIKESFPNAEITTLPEFPASYQNDQMLTKATGFDKVVFVTFCMTACYQGADSLTRRVEAVISSLHASGKVEALVHFGNPFALLPLPHIARKILGYNAAATQKYAIEVLAGKIPAKGKYPFPNHKI